MFDSDSMVGGIWSSRWRGVEGRIVNPAGFEKVGLRVVAWPAGRMPFCLFAGVMSKVNVQA